MAHSVIRRTLASAFAIVALSMVFMACTKEKSTKAIIKVQKEDGTAVVDAYVKLYANPQFPLADPNRLTKELFTNGAGEAEFDYSEFYRQGQSGFAVLDILCTSDTLVGEGIIKIVEEEINRETVVLLPVE